MRKSQGGGRKPTAGCCQEELAPLYGLVMVTTNRG